MSDSGRRYQESTAKNKEASGSSRRNRWDRPAAYDEDYRRKDDCDNSRLNRREDSHSGHSSRSSYDQRHDSRSQGSSRSRHYDDQPRRKSSEGKSHREATHSQKSKAQSNCSTEYQGSNDVDFRQYEQELLSMAQTGDSKSSEEDDELSKKDQESQNRYHEPYKRDSESYKRDSEPYSRDHKSHKRDHAAAFTQSDFLAYTTPEEPSVKKTGFSMAFGSSKLVGAAASDLITAKPIGFCMSMGHNKDFDNSPDPKPVAPNTFSMSMGGHKKPVSPMGFGFSMGLKKEKESENPVDKKLVAPIKMSLGVQKPKAPPTIRKPAAVANVFGDDDSDEEEMPPEAKMRMRNLGRETPTAAGPNSFGKGQLGFCDRQKIIQRELQKKMDEMGPKK